MIGYHPHLDPDQRLNIVNERRYSYTGYFNPSKLKEELEEWLANDKHYDVTELDLTYEVTEKKVELETKVIAEKQLNDDYQTQVMYVINVKSKPVDDKGNCKGFLTISVNGSVVKDFREVVRDRSKFSKFIGEVYDNFFGESEIMDGISEIVIDCGAIIGKVRGLVNSKL